ncbi:hypothetical protein MBLNU230_g8255t1 [Neophaeotheca triangularis]
MEADWAETARLTVPGVATAQQPNHPTAFAFDPVQELLWTGNEAGRITAWFGPELQQYISYKAHLNTAPRGQPSDAHVKQLLFCDKGIISISPKSVHLASRKGLAQWHISDKSMVDLRCMSFTGRRTDELVVAGCQKQLYRIDVDKGTVTEIFEPPTPIPFTLMKRAKEYICAASHDGSVHMLDLKTLAITNRWKPYPAQVNDIDARGDYLLTCGWAPRHYAGLALEPLVRVYDLKNHRPLSPIAFHAGAAFVRMHPLLTSTCIIVSQTGAIQSIDVQNPDSPTIRYMQTYEASLTGLEVMPSGKGFGLSDSNCQITLWGSPTKMQYADFAQPTEFADAVLPAQDLQWSPETPLSMIGMPYYREMLFSGWAYNPVHEVGAPPPKIDPDILNNLRSFEFGAHAPNPRKARRYQVEDTRKLREAQPMLVAPKFLSEKTKDDGTEGEMERRLSEDIGKSLNDLTANGRSKTDIPVWYHNVEIKYSKFGVDDFDFGYYNKTKYSGLETHIANSYANPLLQLFRFTPVVRNMALHHVAKGCRLQTCLLCELGFLVDMLEKAGGQNCQATNFFKALGKHSVARQLKILEEGMSNTPLTVMVQNLSRFLLQKMQENYRAMEHDINDFNIAFGTQGFTKRQCQHCQMFGDAQNTILYTHELVYPPRAARQPGRANTLTFSQVLKASVEHSGQQRGWCSNCQGYKILNSRLEVTGVPAVLTLNAATHSSEAKQAWATPGFLPKEVGIIVNRGQFYCYEGQDLQTHLRRQVYNIVVYELVGVVADVTSGQTQKSHLVSTIDASVTGNEGEQPDNWHVFNDFLVRKIERGDALSFDPRWKLPSVITYQVKSLSRKLDNSWKRSLNTNVLYDSVVQPAFTEDYKMRPMCQGDRIPDTSTHCAIDAEFVRLLREEIDMGADGSRTINRPSRLGLARVSVLRGDEPGLGVPFIDDYIAIDEPVDDYLTQFSGLREGDLSEGHSPFYLVNLKGVYMKLWVMLNLGCIFIGHGLSSDFRIINMYVPEGQLLDTQTLFSLGSRARRKLSLRFLAWAILNEDIQHNTTEGHDSIEDAHTALKLWRKYCEFVDAGILEAKIDEIFNLGRRFDFKVPADKDAVRRRPQTPTAGGSAPGTPVRLPTSAARNGLLTATPDHGSPLR